MKNQQQQNTDQASIRSLLEANNRLFLASDDDDEDVLFTQSDAERRAGENAVLDKDHIISILDEALDILLEDDFAPSSLNHYNMVPNGTTQSQ